jgi:hypothetical protein
MSAPDLAEQQRDPPRTSLSNAQASPAQASTAAAQLRSCHITPSHSAPCPSLEVGKQWRPLLMPDASSRFLAGPPLPPRVSATVEARLPQSICGTTEARLPQPVCGTIWSVAACIEGPVAACMEEPVAPCMEEQFSKPAKIHEEAGTGFAVEPPQTSFARNHLHCPPSLRLLTLGLAGYLDSSRSQETRYP